VYFPFSTSLRSTFTIYCLFSHDQTFHVVSFSGFRLQLCIHLLI
jgi:hypothetical protein